MNCNDVIVCNTDNMNVPKEGNSLHESRNNTIDAFSEADGIEISIVVTAYNRIEKTKNCVKYLLEYTKDFNYNLFLCDNGSSDETLEYFKSIDHPNKKIVKVTKNIGAGFAAEFMSRLINTKYYIGVNNDAYVTKNWLNNLMKCMQSDERIGYVTPMSSNISNLQDPNLKFNSLEEMQRVAEKFNVSDPKKWLERKRLLSVAALFKKEVFDLAGKQDCGFFHDFSDDDWTLRISRAGYKQILCADTFIHHDHNVFGGEGKDPEQYNESLEKGRLNFIQKHYGLDAWSDLMNYEYDLIDLGEYGFRGKNTLNVLGIDTKCGIPLFEVKNKLRLNNKFDVNLYAYTVDAKYYMDLLTVCGNSVKCDRIDFICEHYQKGSFDFAILGEYLNAYANPFKVLENILDVLAFNGQALIKVKNTVDFKTLMCMYGKRKNFHEEILSHIHIDDIIDFLKQKKIKNVKVTCVKHNVNKQTVEALDKSVSMLDINKEDFEKIYVKEYLLCIIK